MGTRPRPRKSATAPRPKPAWPTLACAHVAVHRRPLGGDIVVELGRCFGGYVVIELRRANIMVQIRAGYILVHVCTRIGARVRIGPAVHAVLAADARGRQEQQVQRSEADRHEEQQRLPFQQVHVGPPRVGRCLAPPLADERPRLALHRPTTCIIPDSVAGANYKAGRFFNPMCIANRARAVARVLRPRATARVRPFSLRAAARALPIRARAAARALPTPTRRRARLGPWSARFPPWHGAAALPYHDPQRSTA